MSKARNPNGWARIERDIKLRADFRCECGGHFDCDSNAHHGRCHNHEGGRYPHNKRLIKLRVVQVKPGLDWRPPNLVALCLSCFLLWEKAQKASEPAALEQDALF